MNHDAVRGYVSDVLGRDCSDATVNRFPDGNRHAVYKIADLGTPEDLVVRVSLTDDPAERAAASHEARVLRRVGGVVAPALLDFRLSSPWFDTPVMCLQFVPGSPIDLTRATTAELEQLGSVVARIHLLPTSDLEPDHGDVASYAEGRLLSILSTTTWLRAPLSDHIREGLRGAADIVTARWATVRDSPALRADQPLVLLHGDIAAGNVIAGPDVVLIDWEYARLGDPADDIANTFDQSAFDVAARAAFWRGYSRGMPSREIFARVAWWEPLTLLGSALWWVERWVRRADADATGVTDPGASQDPDYYLDQITRRLHRLEALLGQL